MIGYNPIDKPLIMFYNDRPPISKDFAKYFDDVANLYLIDIPALPNQHEDTNSGKTGAGCYGFFLSNDYPALYLFAGGGTGLDGYGHDNMSSCYHTRCDTIGIGKKDAGVNSMELVKAYTQAALVAIAELAELDYINIEEGDFINCIISPNPTNSTSTVTLYLNDVGNLTVTLNNVLGQELMELHSDFTDTKIFTKTHKNMSVVNVRIHA
jgi:hypothetical protein